MNPGGNGDLYSQIGPGFVAFVVIFALALAMWFLVRSMNSHLRRVRYQQAEDERRARETGAAQGETGVAPGETGGRGAGGSRQE
ncbi:hypothetical protein [Arsenicicoccus sp. oral taxon 190]|uniref:hypothetical protein n=1 Tax=Arsenicicoccus sp. oral taxon 190 TaxID=1658671 RepID=UPI000679F280|nr:hypothetical protein [Arsenicicoccus sp. oral taxon 190]AKT50165.1 hypothetical protein ADJ73_00370 [Arsenicicoccus sp. oral taxon 190]